MYKISIPQEIIDIMSSLHKSGFEAYCVGGSVRDLVLGRKPKDWDIATNAKPEEIQKVFENSYYTNSFGTVTVKTDSDDDSLKLIEVTTYRVESEYTDHRRPDSVEFTDDLKQDLSRRDFTVNAIASDIEGNLFDPFNGVADIKNKYIRCVGSPVDRFEEDALRLMRSVRFATQLRFRIEKSTYDALVKCSSILSKISKERIRDEFQKIIMSDNAVYGIELLRKTKLLEVFMPELSFCYGVGQNKHHIYNVYEHLIKSLEYAVSKNFSLEVRLASLFHDIGKPKTKRGEGVGSTFYNHEVVGAKIASKILTRLRFPKKIIGKVYVLVRYHQFYYTPEEVTASSVRRLIAKVGRENIDDLLQVREADRIGSGVPKAVPYKLRHLKYMIEKVSSDPISPKMLKVNGDMLIKELGIKPGPKLGLILKALLAEVIENPELNKKDVLLKKASEYMDIDDKKLQDKIQIIENAQKKQDEDMKNKYWVK